MSDKSIVAIIDDDESIRKSLVRLIASRGDEVRAFSSAMEFLESAEQKMVSCIVSDLRMPGISGLELQRTLMTKIPFVSMVFLTGHGDIPASVTAMKAGAVDFLEKPVSGAVLLDAIDRAVERSNRLKMAANEIETLKTRYRQLTPKEREVLALVSAGLLNKQAAAELGAALKTVKQHRGVVMRKMEAESLADLVLMADRLGVRRTDSKFEAAKGKLVAR